MCFFFTSANSHSSSESKQEDYFAKDAVTATREPLWRVLSRYFRYSKSFQRDDMRHKSGITVKKDRKAREGKGREGKRIKAELRVSGLWEKHSAGLSY